LAVVGDRLQTTAFETAFPGVPGKNARYADVRYGMAIVEIRDDTGNVVDRLSLTKATVDGLAKASS
jgi:hypothetical protein